ncbi:MAG: HU family DNA-binding protein [Oscillospiraceae bacterium]|nr:HU family DNA-binding protein [Oscillospiraceae bacterium]
MEITKKKFVSLVAERLREKGARKPVSIPKHTFRISDEDGNTSDFTIKERNKTAVYTVDDVATIFESCLEILLDCVRSGVVVNFIGFGSFRAKKHRGHLVRDVNAHGEDLVIEDYYVPKFTAGKHLRLAAKMYGLYLKEHPELEEGEDDEPEEENVEYTVKETEDGDQYCLWK